jgi:phenylalanyl-tRNA synthetase beta subunit
VYAGKGLVEGTKSYTLNIQLQDEEKTLTDNETEAIMEKALNILREKCQATLRA